MTYSLPLPSRALPRHHPQDNRVACRMQKPRLHRIKVLPDSSAAKGGRDCALTWPLAPPQPTTPRERNPVVPGLRCGSLYRVVYFHSIEETADRQRCPLAQEYPQMSSSIGLLEIGDANSLLLENVTRGFLHILAPGAQSIANPGPRALKSCLGTQPIRRGTCAHARLRTLYLNVWHARLYTTYLVPLGTQHLE